MASVEERLAAEDRRAAAAVSRARVEMALINLKAWERVFLRDRFEEHMGALHLWPAHIAEKLLGRHLRFTERFQLTLFMLANKCQPTVYVEWLLKREMLKDNSARQHIVGLLDAHKTGKLETEGKTAYVMDATLPNGDPAPNAMKVRTVDTPNFAHDWQHQHYWDEAIHMLKAGTVNTFKPVPIKPYRSSAAYE